MNVRKTNKKLCLAFFGYIAVCVCGVVFNLISGLNNKHRYPKKIPMEALAEPVSESGSCGTNAQWSFDSQTETLEITGTGSLYTYSKDEHPWSKYYGYISYVKVADSINELPSGIFYSLFNLEELTIPFVGHDASISSSKHYPLGYMFGSDSYEGGVEVYQYQSCDYVSSGKFCASLTSKDYYYIPSNLTTVNVTNAKYIYSGSFSVVYDYCESSDNAVQNPLNITRITLNEGVKNIGMYAFGSVNVRDSSKYLSYSSYQYRFSGLESVNLPSTLETLENGAFYNCRNLSSVEIPGSVKTIGDYAFYSCSKLTITVLKLAGDVTTYQNTFNSVSIVKYFDYYSYTNGNNTFYYNVINEDAVIAKTITTNTDLTLPTVLGTWNVAKVGNMGVANCVSLTSIVIPANIISLGDYAFSGCTGLTTVTIPATCVHVGDYAFNRCENLTTTTIAEGVKYVGDYAFFNCSNLQEIVIPDSCTYLGEGAFYNCSKLKTASIGITVPSINRYTFTNCSSMETVVIGLSVTSIEDFAFLNCSSISRLITRNGLVSIGKGAFMNCTSLSRVSLASTIETIGAYAFSGCKSLKAVVIPKLVTKINESTFNGCTSLATASYNGTIADIENNAFYNTSITDFTFKDGLINLGSGSFAFSKLTSVSLPDSLSSIGQHVFDHCILNSVSLPSSAKLQRNCIRIFENNGSNMVITRLVNCLCKNF